MRAVGRYAPDQVQLSIVSRSPLPDELAAMIPANVRILRDVSNEELTILYRSHHLFAMPSLVEGFGLVYQEALAEGLPVLCTINTGGADIISHGEEGFVIPAGDVNAIADCIDRCLSCRELLPRMSERAQRNAQVWTWEKFREGVRSAVATIERD
jgi:glycosyltransferase involved in cell wall biosynthesis